MVLLITKLVQTSIFGLDWGIEYTTTTGYAASGEDKIYSWWHHVVGYVSASF